MGLFDWINKKATEKWIIEQDFLRERNEQKLEMEREKHDLKLSVAKKQSQLEICRLDYQIRDEQEKLKEDFDSTDDEEDGEGDNPMLKIFGPVVANMMNSNRPAQTPSENLLNPSTPNTIPDGVSFTDDELNEIYKAIPTPYKQIAKTMSEQQIAEFIKGKYPKITQECLNRAVMRVKK